MKNVSQFDALVILGWVVAIGGIINKPVLLAAGVPDSTASNVITIIGFLVMLATVIVNRLKNPSPPAGAVSANIPQGSIPVVAAAPGGGVQTVAIADPSVPLTVTAATVPPPKDEPPLAGKAP